MNVKLHELIVDEEKPFANCELGRGKYAEVLTDIVGNYADGFVLAINNEWGTGKTTFVKMWQQHLNNKDFQTIYFNAWENDFDSSPLVALMSELKTLTNDNNKEFFESFVKKGAVFMKNVAPAFIKAVAENYIDTKIITDAIENLTKATTEILEKEIKEYTNKKKGIGEFKEALEKFVKQTNGQKPEEKSKPLVFIIDELDRCRPDYAVKVLEQIKHFFSVRGIVFVLSIDKKHLASSVKGFYGSESINADEYLRRFIDLEYSIPEPSTDKFVDYLFEYFGFEEFLSHEERIKHPVFDNDKDGFLMMAKFLFDKTKATLRQQEKIFALTRLTLLFFEKNHFVFFGLLFFLIYLKIMKNELYQQIEKKELTFQQLNDEFEKLMYSDSEEGSSYKFDLGYIQFLLLLFYSNGFTNKNNNLFIESKNINIKPAMSIISKIDQNELQNYFGYIGRNQYLPLKYLTDKINLTESINNQ